MAVRQAQPQFAYGVGDNLIQLAPNPIVSRRDPTTADFAQPGTVWVNKTDQTIWMLASVTSNSANWQTSPASGVGIFTSVQVTTGDLDVDQGDVNITLGDLTVAAGNTDLAGDLTVSGTATFNGDIDFASAALIDFTSTLNAAPSILLEANGGTAEQVKLYSNQGTSVSSIYLLSDVGGLTLRATGLASADAINLEAPAGGIDVDAALQINIASSQNAGNAIVLNASAGAIDILAAGAAGEDIDITNTAGSVNITAGEAAADAIVISAGNAAGGVSVAAGTAGIAVAATNGAVAITSGTGAISISADAAATTVNLATGAGAKTVLLGSTNTTSTTTVRAGSGGIHLNAAGLLGATPATQSAASPTASVTSNTNLVVATFTGFTTASAASQVFTITNSLIATTSALFVTASNLGSNDAQMTVTRVQQKAGSVDITLINNGAAALNGNVLISVWVFAA